MTASEFITRDSGERQEYDSGMVRDTQSGKPRFDLLFPQGVPYGAQFLTRVAELLARGAEKYSDRNWEKATGSDELDRFKSSALRHLTQWVTDQTDEDHAAAVVFNLLAYETTKWKIENEPQVIEESQNKQPNSNSGNPCQCAHHKRLRLQSPAIAKGFIR